MAQVLQPWQVLVAVLADWINEHEQAAIEYLRENRVLREQLGTRRLRLTDDQRRRLAAEDEASGCGEVSCSNRLGGMLRVYHRVAAESVHR
jgi:hypothetical protein